MKIKEPDFEEYTVYEHLLPALVNGDFSGLEDDEIALVEEIEAYVDGRIISAANDAESYLGKPEHGGLAGMVVDVNLVRI